MKDTTILLELRVGEGGDDAKLLVTEMANIYLKAARNKNFNVHSVEEKAGRTTICL